LWALARLGTAGLGLLAATSWVSPVSAVDTVALADPAANVPVPEAMSNACAAAPTLACQAATAAAIDVARAREGVAPLSLPAGFYTMRTVSQLLVVADLERTDRGLPAFVGLSPRLNRMALVGAVSKTDPDGPAADTWGANLAIGYTSALQADYAWMYDDGVGSDNADCTPRDRSACWGHRQNILDGYGPHPAMGAAVAKTEFYGQPSVSMTELFFNEEPTPG
jgi:hypothetical protein